jgi:hypothetical protein
MKACFKCGETKPLDQFYRHKMMADGHLNKCKACTCKDARDHRNDNIEAARAYDRSRSRQPHRVEARREYFKRFVEENPERNKAHYAVSNAIRDGRLQKKPCAFCGASEQLEAHHHDYAKPLDVTWLCKPCHRRFHALERMAAYRKDEAA